MAENLVPFYLVDVCLERQKLVSAINIKQRWLNNKSRLEFITTQFFLDLRITGIKKILIQKPKRKTQTALVFSHDSSIDISVIRSVQAWVPIAAARPINTARKNE